MRCSLRQISTHSPRVGRTFVRYKMRIRRHISTHSPRVGRTSMYCLTKRTRQISTHSPRVGRTPKSPSLMVVRSTFQLTRPVWGEPLKTGLTERTIEFQLTRPVWGEPGDFYAARPRKGISTHSPRVGRTKRRRANCAPNWHFNSLAPCGANLANKRVSGFLIAISTHSPRVGRTAVTIEKSLVRDGFQLTRPVWGEPGDNPSPLRYLDDFNSLAPCGANLIVVKHIPSQKDFNSLAPCGANPPSGTRLGSPSNFNSLAPCGANPNRLQNLWIAVPISTHSPRVGRTLNFRYNISVRRFISTHSPRVGRTAQKLLGRPGRQISTHSPRVGRTPSISPS